MQIQWTIGVGDIIELAAFLIVAFSVLLYSKQLRLDRKTRTLDYVTGQFDRLANMGARAELRKMGSANILEYTANDPEKTQRLLEYVYTFNRIGVGIFKRALDEDIVFNIWAPIWFQGHWRRFEPLVRKERELRGEDARGAYVFFDWLVKEKCLKLRSRYPQKEATTLTPISKRNSPQ